MAENISHLLELNRCVAHFLKNGTFLDELKSSPEFIWATKVIYEKGTGKAPP
jgi:hypothetical protein